MLGSDAIYCYTLFVKATPIFFIIHLLGTFRLNNLVVLFLLSASISLFRNNTKFVLVIFGV